jgi:hypothetical protein
MKYQFLLSFLLLILFVTSLSAEETGPLGFGDAEFTQEMETDRPDFTEGALTISPGHFQIEGGYGFVYNDDEGTTSKEHVLPQLLLRVGLFEELELRLGWAGYVHKEEQSGESETTQQGGSDVSVGIKHRLYSQGDYTPEISFIAEMRLPSGANAVTSDDVEPELKLIWAYEMNSDWSMAGNINFASPVEDDERSFETASSFTLAHSLTDRLGAYAEYFGFYPNSEAPESTSTHYINGGFTLGVSDSLQFDALLGFGLNSEADDFFTGFGFATRH